MSLIAAVLGRFLIAIMFIVSGLQKIVDPGPTGQMLAATNLPANFAVPTGVFELVAGVMLAIGLMTSSWTENQLIAFFLSVMLGVLFWWLLGFLLPFVPVEAASVLEWFWFTYHFENMLRGVIDSRDVLFYLSVIGFGLALAFRSLEKRRWS